MVKTISYICQKLALLMLLRLSLPHSLTPTPPNPYPLTHGQGEVIQHVIREQYLPFIARTNLEILSLFYTCSGFKDRQVLMCSSIACTNFLDQEVLTSTLSDLEVLGLKFGSPGMLCHTAALYISFRSAKVKK